MAKSLRSKRKRKMRAIKRVRYGEKELIKLKMIVENASINKSNDNQLVNISLTKQQKPNEINDNKMELDSSVDNKPIQTESIISLDCVRKSIRDSNGHYPNWMTQRHVRKLKNTKSKRIKSKKKLKV